MFSKFAMLAVTEAVSEHDVDSHVVMQVHDELVWECRAEELARFVQIGES